MFFFFFSAKTKMPAGGDYFLLEASGEVSWHFQDVYAMGKPWFLATFCQSVPFVTLLSMLIHLTFLLPKPLVKSFEIYWSNPENTIILTSRRL